MNFYDRFCLDGLYHPISMQVSIFINHAYNDQTVVYCGVAHSLLDQQVVGLNFTHHIASSFSKLRSLAKCPSTLEITRLLPRLYVVVYTISSSIGDIISQ